MIKKKVSNAFHNTFMLSSLAGTEACDFELRDGLVCAQLTAEGSLTVAEGGMMLRHSPLLLVSRHYCLYRCFPLHVRAQMELLLNTIPGIKPVVLRDCQHQNHPRNLGCKMVSLSLSPLPFYAHVFGVLLKTFPPGGMSSSL